jgi:hypothetical protein
MSWNTTFILDLQGDSTWDAVERRDGAFPQQPRISSAIPEPKSCQVNLLVWLKINNSENAVSVQAWTGMLKIGQFRRSLVWATRLN